MKKKPEIFKKTILAIILLFLVFPILQNNLNLFSIAELRGSFYKADNADFIFDDWFEGNFQQKKEKYLNEQFGLRATLVKINNQLRFEFFKKSSNKEIVFGKDGYLFIDIYVQTYCGENLPVIKKIAEKCRLVKILQDSLSKRGQIFLPVIAPNKARVLHDLLPDNVHVKNVSIYEIMILFFKKLNIKYVDFNDYFIKTYKTAKYPLFTKYGIHWSSYGHTLVADSLTRYLNYNYRLNAPTMNWKEKITMSDSLRELDYDIAKTMNLLVNQLPSDKMAYPKISYNDNNQKPSLLVIGDSFNSGLEKTDFQNQAFSNYKFFYYFRELFPYVSEDGLFKLKIKDEILKHKVILMVNTEHNFNNYGWGFLEKATGILDGTITEADMEYENKIHITEFAVRKNKEWFNKIKEQAANENKNLDTLIYLNAKYIVDSESVDGENSFKKMIKQIKKDKKWMKDIERKALERKISIDSMITVDAIYVLQNSK